MRVLVALSGGVDSSVAAARVVAAGHEAVGVHMALSSDRAQERVGARGCCTIDDARDARRVADKLNIPFYVWDLSEPFKEEVMEDFIAEYKAGNTPNPCVRCNEKIKFATLLDKAMALGFDAVATGHYAQVLQGDDGYELHRAVDSAKDQSYVLAVMGPEALSRSIFPLGDVADKATVRAEAAELGFSTALKPDSHDICFIPDGNTRAWLDARVPRNPGDIVDADGDVLGQHDGAIGYTVGQRKGLHIGRPASDGKPRYVLNISVADNTVTVGSKDDLLVRELTATNVVWLTDSPAPDEVLSAQVRAHGTPFDVTVTGDADSLMIIPVEPVPAVAAGQTIVVYRGTRALVAATATRSGGKA